MTINFRPQPFSATNFNHKTDFGKKGQTKIECLTDLPYIEGKGYCLNDNSVNNTNHYKVYVNPTKSEDAKAHDSFSRSFTFNVSVETSDGNKIFDKEYSITSEIKNPNQALAKNLLKKDGNCLIYDVFAISNKLFSLHSEKFDSSEFDKTLKDHLKNDRQHLVTLQNKKLSNFTTASLLLIGDTFLSTIKSSLLKIGSIFSQKINDIAIAKALTGSNSYDPDKNLFDVQTSSDNPLFEKKNNQENNNNSEIKYNKATEQSLEEQIMKGRALAQQLPLSASLH